MGGLGGAGSHTTNLVGREVKRTFSEFGSFSTGLPDRQTPEAGGQDLGDFDQVLSLGFGGHALLSAKRSEPVYDFT
jgi:hypothetical protein